MPNISKHPEIISIFLKKVVSPQRWTKNKLERGELTQIFLQVEHGWIVAVNILSII